MSTGTAFDERAEGMTANQKRVVAGIEAKLDGYRRDMTSAIYGVSVRAELGDASDRMDYVRESREICQSYLDETDNMGEIIAGLIEDNR